MFCPNCGTQNPETSQTCSKCAFNLKGAAAPKFKGTMLMMNQPGAAAGAPPAPPRPAGVPTPPPAPAPAFGGVGAAGPSKLKGTMVGVAPPMPGAAPAPPPFGAPAGQPGSSPPAFGAPPPEAAAYPQAPPAQGGQYQPPGQGPANPLAGTMAADPGAFGGGFGAPPPAHDPYASGAGGSAGAGGQAPGGFPQQQPQQGYGGAPQQQQYGAPVQQQGMQQQAQQGAQDFGNAAAGGFNQLGDAAGQGYGAMAQAAGYGGGQMQPPQQPYGAPPPGGYGGGFGGPGGPMGPGTPGQLNTTQPLIFAIVSVFCCWPAAIVAIIFALQSKKLAEQGQLDAAMAKAKTSKLISFIAIGLGVVAIILNVIVRVLH